jgi:UDP-N-acetylmuramate: L-alanyl-gamma-D-glutamyl-meso-diaminopimelate ligase
MELSEERLIEDLKAGGCVAWFVPAVDEIVEMLASRSETGDVILVMSNGSFGGLHQKLLGALAGR